MLYTIVFSFAQLGQVKRMVYPDLVPVTVGFALFFIMSLVFLVMPAHRRVERGICSFSGNRYTQYALCIPCRR